MYIRESFQQPYCETVSPSLPSQIGAPAGHAAWEEGSAAPGPRPCNVRSNAGRWLVHGESMVRGQAWVMRFEAVLVVPCEIAR